MSKKYIMINFEDCDVSIFDSEEEFKSSIEEIYKDGEVDVTDENCFEFFVCSDVEKIKPKIEIQISMEENNE